ncbi:MAG: nucleotide sugar dehydrogenase [Methanoregulaceae archaeon]|jgi:nucleotide sugar dehydrogenase
MINNMDDRVIMNSIENIFVLSDKTIFDVISTIENAQKMGLPAGIGLVVDEIGHLEGVITDGDIRAALLKGFQMDSSVKEIMTKDPVVILHDTPFENILDEIQQQIIDSGRIRVIRYAILIDSSRKVLGLIDVNQVLISAASRYEIVGIIGLGYVGLTLAVSLAEVGYTVIGWDSNTDIRESLSEGILHIHEKGLDAVLKAQLYRRKLKFASHLTELSSCRVFIICVNTPVINSIPELRYIDSAIRELCTILKKGDLIILRSTVPIGTCTGLVRKIIETHTNHVVGKDIGISFAPERTVEGKALEELKTLPQIVGGNDSWSCESTIKIFSRLSPSIIRMNSLEEAEFVKLINNSFRDVSFAFANEVALMCDEYNLNAGKIIKAANSGYPRNTIASPSPGVGGSCLKKDPYVFISGKSDDGIPSLTRIGRQINEMMPLKIAQKIISVLRECNKNTEDSSVFILGFAYKGEPETIDTRDSPTLDLIGELRGKIDNIYGWDPIVPRTTIENFGIIWKDIEDGFRGSDAVLIMNNHRSFSNMDVTRLLTYVRRPAVFFDGWNLFDQNHIEQIEGIRYMTMGYITPVQLKEI